MFYVDNGTDCMARCRAFEWPGFTGSPHDRHDKLKFCNVSLVFMVTLRSIALDLFGG